MSQIDRDTYCRDCSRSIWGDKSCDVNVENDGKYTLADDKCYNKCNENGKVEKYPWEESEEGDKNGNNNNQKHDG